MTLYDRLPYLIEGCNKIARTTGVRRRITICFRCPAHGLVPPGPHFVACRADTMPASVMR